MTKNILYFYIVDKKIQYEATLWPEILGSFYSSYNNIFYFDIQCFILLCSKKIFGEFMGINNYVLCRDSQLLVH